jgi:DNA-binding PadR family transcriptional regulator
MRHVVTKRRPERVKPLTEPVFWILLSLAEQSRHGYALMKDVESISGGRVRLSTGTMYGALRRLLEDSWIERVELADTSREKQPYRLTSVGRAQLKYELNRLTQLTHAAATRLKPGGV